MRTSLEQSLKQTSAECVGFQLLEIDLPTTFEDSIVQTQVEKQNIIMKGYEQQAQIIRKRIDVDISENAKNVTIINTAAEANATLITQTAKAEATSNNIGIENEAYKNVTRDLGLEGTNLNKYVYSIGLLARNASAIPPKLLVGLDSAMPIVNL